MTVAAVASMVDDAGIIAARKTEQQNEEKARMRAAHHAPGTKHDTVKPPPVAIVGKNLSKMAEKRKGLKERQAAQLEVVGHVSAFD